MSGKHWNDDQLLDRLYGLEPESSHLSQCADCNERWLEMEASRRSLLSQDVPVPPSRLLQQRLIVMDRIERAERSFFSWKGLATFAGATAMIAGVWIFTPQHPKPIAVQTASSDTQFFSEIYSEVQQSEPRAIKPIEHLFQERR